MVVSLRILLRAGVFPGGLGAFRYMSQNKTVFRTLCLFDVPVECIIIEQIFYIVR